jgi:thiosulfate/3-mercaptopyruvate sulfurtransferase
MKKLLCAIPLALLAFAAGEMATIQPAELAAQLSAKPAIFYVGPNVMYRGKHIPGAIYAGPGNKAEGIALLKEAVAKLPRDREILIYCGCCPWDKCPNMQPAFAALREMGFTKAKGVYMAENFKTNWLDKGYPFE